MASKTFNSVYRWSDCIEDRKDWTRNAEGKQQSVISNFVMNEVNGVLKRIIHQM